MMSVKQCTKESGGVATNFLYHYIFVPHTHEWQLKLRSGSDSVNIETVEAVRKWLCLLTCSGRFRGELVTLVGRGLLDCTNDIIFCHLLCNSSGNRERFFILTMRPL